MARRIEYTVIAYSYAGRIKHAVTFRSHKLAYDFYLACAMDRSVSHAVIEKDCL